MGFRAIKRGAIRVLGPLGAYPLLRRATRRSPRVFMYHRFSEQPSARTICAASFRKQLYEISRRFNVVTLAELYRIWQAEGEPPANTAVITVDDGYGDFATVAWPILKEAGLPATLFVSTRFTDGDFWLWPDKLEYALFSTTEPVLSLQSREWTLENDASRWRCFEELCAWFTRIDDAEKHQWIDRLYEVLEVALPEQPTEEYAPVPWPRLRELADAGIEIGGHTRTHPVLSRLPLHVLDEEIAGCKTEIEAKLGREIHTFCYPNGQPEDINDAVRDAVRRAGFDCAVAAYFRSDVMADPFEIKRYAASENQEQFLKNMEGVEYVSSVLQQRFGI